MENNVNLIAKDLKLRSEAMAAGASMPAMNDAGPEIDLVIRQALKTGSELMASCAALASGPHELAINVLIRSLIESVLKPIGPLSQSKMLNICWLHQKSRRKPSSWPTSAQVLQQSATRRETI